MKKTTNTPGTALVPVGKTVTYPIASTAIEATQLYHVPARHPRGAGSWQRERDKVAWVDSATGLACTILRDRDGSLGGYVAVTADHPLFGFEADAIPSAFGITPHGGIDQARGCEDGPEEITICHPRPRPTLSARLPAGDDLWWFGFRCDKNHDYIPRAQVADDLCAENGRVYRTEGYVYGETIKLAGQLAALTGEGGSSGVPLATSAAPPIGLDPETKR